MRVSKTKILLTLSCLSFLGCQRNPIDRLTGHDSHPSSENSSENVIESSGGKNSKTSVIHADLKGELNDGFGNLTDINLSMRMRNRDSHVTVAGHALFRMKNASPSWKGVPMVLTGTGVAEESGDFTRVKFDKLFFKFPKSPFTTSGEITDREGNTYKVTMTWKNNVLYSETIDSKGTISKVETVCNPIKKERGQIGFSGGACGTEYTGLMEITEGHLRMVMESLAGERADLVGITGKLK